MKRLGLLILTVCMLVSCSQEALRDPLHYQQYPFCVEGELSWMGAVYGVKLEMEAPHIGALYFLTPETVAGTVMRYTPEGVVTERGSVSFAVSEDRVALTALYALCEAYSIEERSPIHYTHDGFTSGGITYICDDKGYPTSLDGNGFSFSAKLYSQNSN